MRGCREREERKKERTERERKSKKEREGDREIKEERGMRGGREEVKGKKRENECFAQASLL